MQSEQIDKLAEALAAAQGEFKPIKKSKTAKVRGVTKTGKEYEYEYNYADLAEVLDAIRPALSKHGIAIVQPLTMRDNTLVLETRLLHSSGQWIGAEYPVPLQTEIQKQGAAITYLRRYSISCLAGVASEDDTDAQEVEPEKPKRGRPPNPPPDESVEYVTRAQAQEFIAACKAKGMLNEHAKELMEQHTGATSSKLIPADKFQALMEAVNAIP